MQGRCHADHHVHLSTDLLQLSRNLHFLLDKRGKLTKGFTGVKDKGTCIHIKKDTGDLDKKGLIADVW
jgi:hypothetical protein